MSKIKSTIIKIFSNRKTYFWLAFFIFTVIIHRSHTINADEGYVLSVAWDIFQGKELYSDIFAFVTPGSFYLLVLVWKIFGASFWIARGLSIVAIFFASVGVFKISRALGKSKYAYSEAIIFMLCTAYWPLISYHTFSLLFIVWAAYFSLLALTEKRISQMAASGLFTGLTIVFLQPAGLMVFGAIGLFQILQAIKEKSQARAYQILIFGVMALLPPSLLLLKWPASTLWQNLVSFPSKNYQAAASVSLTYLYIFLILLALIILFLRNKNNQRYYQLYFIQFILLLSTSSLADHFHVTKFLFPIFALIPFILDTLETKSCYCRSAGQGLAALIVFFIFYPSLVILLSVPPFAAPAENARIMERFEKYCAGSDYIYSGPFLPNFYFEMRKKNPSPHHWLITNHHTPEQFAETLKGIIAHQPKCALLNFQIVEKYHYNKDNPVDNYLMSNYNYIETIRGVSIYRKK